MDGGEEGGFGEAGEDVVRYAGLKGSSAGERVSGERGKKEEGTDPKVVPWSPILMMSATLSFMRIAPMGTPWENLG